TGSTPRRSSGPVVAGFSLGSHWSRSPAGPLMALPTRAVRERRTSSRVVHILDPQYRSYCGKLSRPPARSQGSDLMNEANDDAIWERTLQTLRRDDTVSQRVIALLTLSRLMAVVADTALVAAPSTSAKELFEHRIAASLKAALTEATGRDVRFAVTVDESLLLEGDTPDPVPPLTSSSAPESAHRVDNAVDSGPQDVHTAPFRRDEGSVLPASEELGRAAMPHAGSVGSPAPSGAE